MVDRVVVLRSEDALGFVDETCAALAEAVNQVRLVRSGDEALVDVYAKLVIAYSRLVHRQLTGEPAASVRVNIIDHLVERLRQARNSEITIPVLDVVDRLHAELTRQPAAV